MDDLRDIRFVEHLGKGKSGRYYKTVFYFLEDSDLIIGNGIVKGKRVIMVMGRVPNSLHGQIPERRKI